MEEADAGRAPLALRRVFLGPVLVAEKVVVVCAECVAARFPRIGGAAGHCVAEKCEHPLSASKC